MPIELFLSPLMGPIVRIRAALMNIHRESSIYTPIIVDLPRDVSSYSIRMQFGTGSKVYSVFDNSVPGPVTQAKRKYHLVRSRAVKGSYKMYMSGDEKPIAALRAGLRSNVLLMKAADGTELELGWHVVSHKTDAIGQYLSFQLSDGYTYHWTVKGHFLERVHNPGQKEAEVRERLAQVFPHPNRRGFDLVVSKSYVSLEMVINTALICYIEAWNTRRGYGGIYLAD